ncbi:hypothetical protein Y032_0765g2155 [Ancylostoma ceylanicum]|uniref:Uncharacterized protein n=1 Tax=Ancylostoma ceylanicum TaxID=53326 RepID=A0A016WFJ7_9BILA|nr:hypothetical protein Y032_0765g2155 [Ancylostoma ceylanicum]
MTSFLVETNNANHLESLETGSKDGVLPAHAFRTSDYAYWPAHDCVFYITRLSIQVPRRAHVVRADDASVCKIALSSEVLGKQLNGRPKQRWLDTLHSELKLTGIHPGARSGQMVSMKRKSGTHHHIEQKQEKKKKRLHNAFVLFI